MALVPSAHGQAYVAGAKVVASGPVRMETETNAEGRYAFRGVAPGTYTIEATFSGLEAVQTITVTSLQIAQVALYLKL
jgi:Carboxypeptidase regulatory-like domain